MRLFLPFALFIALIGCTDTHASLAEQPQRLLESSDATPASNTEAQAASNPHDDASNAPKAAPAPSNSTSATDTSSNSVSDPPPSSQGSSGGGSPTPKDSGGGAKTSSGGAKKDESGSFAAPVAAPTTAPKKDEGGSFMQPVAAPASADDPVPVTHAAAATDDDDVNATIGGASSTPGNSEPLAHHVYKTVSKNSTIILPEGDQPQHWPEILVILFTAATIVLCGLAVKRSCYSKRRNYEQVPTTLIV